MLEKIADPKELGKVPVEGTGGKLRLSDVSDIKVDHQPLIGDAVVNDADGLLLVVEKFPGANTAEVTEGVEDALEKLSPGLRGMEVDTSVFRPATFIEDAVDNIALTVTIAAVLAALMLAAFLFHWRTVLVALVTIPVSLVAAAVVLDLLGESLNAISFAGLAIGLAVVVDDAVAGAENVSRRLREHRESGADGSVASVVVEATHEVRSPLAYGDAHRPAGDRAGRRDGGPARGVLRAARAGVRAGGRRRDGRRADADARAQPAAGLPRAARRRLAAGRPPAPALRRRALRAS